MSNYKIHIINTEYQGAALSIAAFLVETDQGFILVETGPHSTLPTLVKGIQRCGLDWKDIQHVFLTHIHLDHAGAAWCFAENGATIYLHPLGYKHMLDPSRLLKSATMIYGDMMDTLWGTLKPIPAEQLVIVEDEEVISVCGLDFKSIHSPGHAKHHIAWQLENNLFAGDVAGVSVKGGPVIPPCPPPDINIEDWVDSIDKILNIKDIDVYYITHYGEITNTYEHMEALKKVLNQYANFMLPYYQNRTSPDEIIKPFTEYAISLLKKANVSDDHINAYQMANPAYMSVRGLMRYWEKKLMN
ncbi:MAG: MBL fold metallo-hydrolase [Saprospiraceae bacterium]